LSELKKHPLNYRPKNQKEDEPSIYYGVLSKVIVSGKKVEGTVEPQVLILYSTNKAKLDEDKRTTLLGRYLESLKKISGQLNHRTHSEYDLRTIESNTKIDHGIRQMPKP
jgi:hypothetical protein